MACGPGCGCKNKGGKEGGSPVGKSGIKIGNAMCASSVWLDGLYLNFSSGDLYMPAQEWADSRDSMDGYVLLEFTGTGGSSLTVQVQTAAALTAESAAWLDVTSASVTMGQTRQVKLRWSVAIPPMAVLRLKFTAAAAVTGVLRAQLTLKEPA